LPWQIQFTVVSKSELIVSVGSICSVFVAVFGPGQMLLPAYSGYFVALNPGPQVLQAAEQSQVLALVLQVLCALILIVLVLLLSLCLLQRYTKQVAEAQGMEMTLTNSFRYFTCILSTTAGWYFPY
jgi:cytochrome bd-type quinol oxidase subunit 2